MEAFVGFIAVVCALDVVLNLLRLATGHLGRPTPASVGVSAMVNASVALWAVILLCN